MSNVDKAVATQLANIQKRTGRTLAELGGIVRNSGLTKHGELVKMLKSTFGMGHGDATLLVHHVRQEDAQPGGREKSTAGADPADGLYTGKKAHLRPIHDRLMDEVSRFGTFEIAPKKSYLSLRRKKQFAMIGPATQSQVEVGLNVKGLGPAARLAPQPPKGMCDYKVRLGTLEEADGELVGWLRQAYDGAG